MLVLRRRVGEIISIGDGIEIEVLEISHTRVKLGVVAPRDIPVMRKETIAVAAENRRALELVTAGPEGVRAALAMLNGGSLSRP